MAHIIYDKSIIEMLALFLLQKGELYAYDIMRKIGALSGNALAVQGGTLYPILYKLTEKGFVTDRVEVIGRRGRMTRVYYRITPEGEDYLRSLIATHRLVQQGIADVFQNGETEDRA